MTDPYCTPNDPLRAPVSLFFPLWADYPFVLCFQDPASPSKVEGKLSEEGDGGIFDDGGKPCPGSVVMEMGEPEILFDYIADLGDGLVTCHFERGEIGSSCGLSHDSVGDAICGKEGPVGFSEVPLVGVDLLYGFTGMTASGDAQREIGAVMVGCRGDFRSKEESVAGIDGGMFLEAEEGLVFFGGPVRFDIPGELEGVPLSVQFPFPGLSFVPFFRELSRTDGTACRLYQSGINGDTFGYGTSPGGELVQEFAVDPAQGVLGESSSEAGEGGVIRCRIIEGKSQEPFEGDAVVDLGFEFRIGIDMEPLLEKEAFHQENWGVGPVSFMAVSDRIGSHEKVFDTGPVHDGVDLFHSFDGPVLFHCG